MTLLPLDHRGGWVMGIMNRHEDVSLWPPEPTSIARSRGFYHPQVSRFFTLLWELREKHEIEPTCLYKKRNKWTGSLA